MTPMMQQYREAKERHPGMLLLFRMGDFYELFFEDAEVASRLLGMTLTSRDKGVPMAGFPHHQLEGYLHKLLHHGHRVAVCDQVEDPTQAKGLVRREVTRVVTPGTLTEEDMLDPRQSNHLAAMTAPASRGPVGLAWVELSTGLFQAADVDRDRQVDELGRLRPSELLISEAATTSADAAAVLQQVRDLLPSLFVTTRPDWNFERATCLATLFGHFHISTLAGFGFDDEQSCVAAAGALLIYLQETHKANLGHIGRLRPYTARRFLFLDEVTRRSLELTRTLRDNVHSGSLLSVIDRTVTPMGARLLQDWMQAPLADRQAIEARFDAVGELVEDHSVRQELRAALGEARDLQRLTARVSTGRASPRDLAAVGRTLSLLPRIKAVAEGRQAALLRDLDSRLELCPDLRELLESALVDQPPVSPRDGGVIRRGYNADLDHLHDIATSGKDWIARFQAQEIARTGIPSLKVGYNQVFGYYIEITHTHSQRIPEDYQRKQTLKNAERYITPELKEHEAEVLGAQEKIGNLEYDLFVQIRDRVAAETSRLMQTAEVLAALDVLGALAEVAAERNYTRPSLSDEAILDIHDGRHPVLDQVLPPGTFVPNDVHLSGEAGMFLLVTGPNMGGKSVYLRQTALLTIMAQMGSFVPAQSATIGLVDRVFTRVGASDELMRAQSTFMVEMTEAANILNNATAKSLVILDEIGRGTSTYDGVSLAWAIAEYLHDRIGCRALFATHYHELAQLAEHLPQLRTCNVLVHEGPEGIILLHKVAPGSTDKSYGIHVAERAGVPGEVVSRAREVLAELERHHLDTPERPAARIRRPKVVQASLFASIDDPILEELRELDLAHTSPADLIARIRRWQRDLGKQAES
jgi:DNA mismatch repair protein MutS